MKLVLYSRAPHPEAATPDKWMDPTAFFKMDVLRDLETDKLWYCLQADPLKFSYYGDLHNPLRREDPSFGI